MNLDIFLLEIAKYGFDKLSTAIPKRDLKILKSLTSIIESNKFITENQSKLLTKILTEQQDHLGCVSSELHKFLENPQWSRAFRKIDQTRKIYTTKDAHGEAFLVVEFAYHGGIHKIIQNFKKNAETDITATNGRTFVLPLTEKNIELVVDGLKDYNFTISETVKEYYDIIKSWNFDEISEKFNITKMTEGNMLTHFSNHVGELENINENIFYDRSLRYQYSCKKPENYEKSIKNLISYRKNTNLWINSNEFTLEDIIKELKNLNRLPLLVVFDSFSPAQAITHLKTLEKSLEILDMEENVGIYFRLDNIHGAEFNSIIAKKQYNTKLASDTVVAGVTAGKLPKFFIKNQWKPMSVISLGTRLRHSKTAIYASCCDLVIDYTPTESLMESKNIWLP